MAITPDGKHAYVANNGDGTVSVITTATGVVSATIPVGASPGGVAFTPDGKHAYVANNGDGTVSVITTATGVVSGTFTIGTNPAGVAITPDGKHAYVANNSTGSVFDAPPKSETTRCRSSTRRRGPCRPRSPSATAPIGVTITPDGKHVYVANNGDGTVSVIDTATGAVSDTIAVGNDPRSVAICPA